MLVARREQVEAAASRRPAARGRARGGAARGPAGPRRGPGDLVRAVRAAERLRGTQSLAAERVRNAAGADRRPVDAGPRPRAARGRGRRAARAGGRDRRGGREQPRRARGRGDRAPRRPRTPPPRRTAGSPGSQRAAADRREGLARLHGQVNALRSAAAAADDEIGRLEQAREEAVARADRAQRDFTSLETRVAGLDAGEEGLDAEHEAASAALDDLEERLAKARDEAQQRRPRPVRAGRPQGRPRARPATARTAPARCSPPTDRVSGLLGSVAALLTVRARLRGRGRQRARLRRRRGGRRPTPTPPSTRSTTSRPTTSAAPGCSLGAATPPGTTRAGRACPAGATYAVDVVECPGRGAPRADPAAGQGRRRRRPRPRRARLVADTAGRSPP